jgi:tRNA wybutosine-synthesizing protein 3
MPQNNFNKRKQNILSKTDKSSKKSWDDKIKSLCEKINSLENYYTTSSCSGRIVLMIEQDKKQQGLFLKVYHNLISFNQIKKDLNNIIASLCSDIDDSDSGLRQESSFKISINNKKEKNRDKIQFEAINKRAVKRAKLIKFKQEPCILHIACKNLKDAQNLYNKAKLAGWKKSGIISFKDRIVIELNSTEKLEFPIINKDKILVNDEFLKVVIHESNKKLKKSWEKIEKLEKLNDSKS